jgi:hypothetical protein
MISDVAPLFAGVTYAADIWGWTTVTVASEVYCAGMWGRAKALKMATKQAGGAIHHLLRTINDNAPWNVSERLLSDSAGSAIATSS